MKEIELHSKKYPGLVALVDDADYELVSAHRWHPKAGPHSRTFYADSSFRINGVTTNLAMHKLITGYAKVDHKDHNGLNNQRHNLREATCAQNNANQVLPCTNKSGLKGVRWVVRHSHHRYYYHYWLARIQINGKTIHLGYFKSQIEAALAYDLAAIEAYGEFAYTNQMLGRLPVKADLALVA
jgi:hypothetical protein